MDRGMHYRVQEVFVPGSAQERVQRMQVRLAEYVRLVGRQLAEEALAEEAPVAGPGRSRGEGVHTP